MKKTLFNNLLDVDSSINLWNNTCLISSKFNPSEPLVSPYLRLVKYLIFPLAVLDKIVKILES